MSEGEPDALSYYLSELYKNLNLISQKMEQSVGEIDPEHDQMDETIVNELESKFSEWMSSFYNIIIYLFCTTIAFLAGLVNNDLTFIPIVMFVFFPEYLWFTFLYSIPEIVIDGEVVFSRKNLTLRKQIELARSLFTFFVRQLYENSKGGIIIMFGYIAFFVIVVINEYLL